jgi:hypothetical protein
MDVRLTLAVVAFELFLVGGAFFMIRAFKRGKLKARRDPPDSGNDGARLLWFLAIAGFNAILLAWSWVSGNLRW